jgi:hypothetical protein
MQDPVLFRSLPRLKMVTIFVICRYFQLNWSLKTCGKKCEYGFAFEDHAGGCGDDEK